MHELGTGSATQDLGRAVGDDLVGVGVGRGTGTGLVDVDGELVVEPAVDDLLGGFDDRPCLLLRQQAELQVGLRGGLLDQAERADESSWEGLAGDGKLRTARCVEAP